MTAAAKWSSKGHKENDCCWRISLNVQGSWILTQNILVGIIVINVFNFSILSQCSKQNVVSKKKDYIIYYCNISNAGGS